MENRLKIEVTNNGDIGVIDAYVDNSNAILIVPATGVIESCPLCFLELWIELELQKRKLNYGMLMNGVRTAEYVNFRHNIAYILREKNPKRSLKDIGKAIGVSNHTSVLHAINTIRQDLDFGYQDVLKTYKEFFKSYTQFFGK